MAEQTPGSGYRERLVDEVTANVTQRHSTGADEQVVREKAEQAVDELIDAPVQSFVPLLAENEVVSDLQRAPGANAEG
jgi:hypothetical protein